MSAPGAGGLFSATFGKTVDFRAKVVIAADMGDETVTTRELCDYIADDSKEALDRIQTWVARGLFEAVGCGPLDKYTGRGRARRYPTAAKYWCAAFRRLFDAGLQTRDILRVVAPIRRRLGEDPDFIDRTAAEGRPVWLAYNTEPMPGSTTNVSAGEATISADAPSIPVEWRAWKGFIRCVDLTWLFSPGHE
jgi:hypothetical protein